MTWHEAIGLSPDHEIRVLAWLVMHAQPCPPCPKDHQCEQCLPELPLFADRPPKDKVHPARHHVWVDYRMARIDLQAARLDLRKVPEGQMFLLLGSWERHRDIGPRFVAHEMRPLWGCQDPLGGAP